MEAVHDKHSGRLHRIYPKWKKDKVANGTQKLALNCWTLVWETSTDE
jgi:hypothetical protein